MKNILLSICCALLVVSFFAQMEPSPMIGDTNYHYYSQGELLSNGSTKTSRFSGVVISGYSVKMAFNSLNHKDKIYHLYSDKIMAEGEVYDTLVVSNEIHQNMTIKNGIYKEWYRNGVLKKECTYTNGILNGEFKIYYLNGNMKRIEYWNMGEWDNGRCFDENGIEVDYCTYYKNASFIGDKFALSKYISNNIKYPRKAMARNIQGKVIVKFVVDKDGFIMDPVVIKSVHKLLDDEGLRLIGNMPKWNPGQFEGEYINTYYSIPLNFQLQ